MEPLVSILIPAYNAEAHLAETIRSALGQTWKNTEVIVIDDGSKDRTLEIARRFASDRLKVVTQKNQGAAATRNNLFALSKGDYIQWLDADDLLSPNKISGQIAALNRAPSNERVLLSCGWGHFHFRAHKAEFIPTALWHDLTPAEWMVLKIANNLHMQTATWLVSRKTSIAAGLWNTQLLGDDDGEYFSRILLASDSVRFVPESRVYYRRPGQTSLSHIGRSEKKLKAQFASMLLTIGYVRSVDDSPRGRGACVTYLQNWLHCFYPDHPDIVKQAEQMAESLGGKLSMPTLSWKYAWIQKLAGWNAAKNAQAWWAGLKWPFLRSWDKALYRLQGQKGVDGLGA